MYISIYICISAFGCSAVNRHIASSLAMGRKSRRGGKHDGYHMNNHTDTGIVYIGYSIGINHYSEDRELLGYGTDQDGKRIDKNGHPVPDASQDEDHDDYNDTTVEQWKKDTLRTRYHKIHARSILELLMVQGHNIQVAQLKLKKIYAELYTDRTNMHSEQWQSKMQSLYLNMMKATVNMEDARITIKQHRLHFVEKDKIANIGIPGYDNGSDFYGYPDGIDPAERLQMIPASWWASEDDKLEGGSLRSLTPKDAFDRISQGLRNLCKKLHEDYSNKGMQVLQGGMGTKVILDTFYNTLNALHYETLEVRRDEEEKKKKEQASGVAAAGKL